MHKTLLLLGTNVGNKEENLLDARRMIGKDIGRIEMLSSIYETAAWGKEDQAAYLNQVLVVSTTKTALELMQQILKIESDMGRVRLEKWAPRVIDIDILFFDNLVLHGNLPWLRLPNLFLITSIRKLEKVSDSFCVK